MVFIESKGQQCRGHLLSCIYFLNTLQHLLAANKYNHHEITRARSHGLLDSQAHEGLSRTTFPDSSIQAAQVQHSQSSQVVKRRNATGGTRPEHSPPQAYVLAMDADPLETTTKPSTSESTSVRRRNAARIKADLGNIAPLVVHEKEGRAGSAEQEAQGH